MMNQNINDSKVNNFINDPIVNLQFKNIEPPIIA